MNKFVSRLKAGLIKWLTYREHDKILCITKDKQDAEAFAFVLSDCRGTVDSMILKEIEDGVSVAASYRYDYIIAVDVIEYSKVPESILQFIHHALKEHGRLILGMDNRLGIRYFCGDRDQFTDRSFDSIENYVRADNAEPQNFNGKSYARAEIIQMLEKTGFYYRRFYSVYPVLQRPQIIFAEDYLPNEQMDIRIFPQYNYPDSVFLEEERLYDTLIKNGLFHAMANGFLIECSFDGEFSDALQVTMQMDRGEQYALFTIIQRNGQVVKKAVYESGTERITMLMDNTAYLSAHGIKMVPGIIREHQFVMPYIRHISALEYLRKLLLRDQKLFLEKMDELWGLIQGSSEHVPYDAVDWNKFDIDGNKGRADDPNKDRWRKLAYGTAAEQESIGVILKRGYIDLVPLNCFYTGSEFLFFDQEIYIEELPAKTMMLRTIDLIYAGNLELYGVYAIERLKDRYHLNECQSLFYSFIRKFLDDLRNDQALEQYHKQVRPKYEVIHANRQRMNYSVSEYERIFRDIFKGTENRRIFLFGSGNFTKQFLSQFGTYNIAGIVDNDSQKWGTLLDNVEIMPPNVLKNVEAGTYKVIVCIKNYLSVIRQLRKMGIYDYSVYDSSLTYPRKQVQTQLEACEAEGKRKKYQVGYIAGVFDLFHIGHLNLFRRAKALCDHLIVGVVTDEGVINDKRTSPFVPFAERMELVRSCRYVDEVVMIPPDRSNTDEAYRRYQFDVQFSGSDYAQDKNWLAKKEFLNKQGADLVFFPYTQSTSSTKIKELINKKLV